MWVNIVIFFFSKMISNSLHKCLWTHPKFPVIKKININKIFHDEKDIKEDEQEKKVNWVLQLASMKMRRVLRLQCMFVDGFYGNILKYVLSWITPSYLGN